MTIQVVYEPVSIEVGNIASTVIEVPSSDPVSIVVPEINRETIQIGIPGIQGARGEDGKDAEVDAISKSLIDNLF